MSASEQLEWFQEDLGPRCAERWSLELSAALGRPVKLSYGRARHNVVVAKSVGAELHVRLNQHFAEAPSEVGEALVSWLKNGKRARRANQILDTWIEELNARLGRQPKRAPSMRQIGSHFDLEPLAKEVIQAEFQAQLPSEFAPWEARITWGRRGSRRARRSIQLGSYDPEQRIIRIHPVLDQAFVPRFFLRYVLFHELLHAALDPHPRPANHKRERPHPLAFRQREKVYPEFARALAWQKANLRNLLSSARQLS